MRNSAAASAAPANGEKVIIDTEGRAIEDKPTTFESISLRDFSEIKSRPEEMGAKPRMTLKLTECASCQEPNLKL